MLLLFCAFLISIISKKTKSAGKKSHRKWVSMKWLFIFLAIDEALQIHEVLIIPDLKPMLPAIFSIVWVIPYGILVLFTII